MGEGRCIGIAPWTVRHAVERGLPAPRPRCPGVHGLPDASEIDLPGGEARAETDLDLLLKVHDEGLLCDDAVRDEYRGSGR